MTLFGRRYPSISELHTPRSIRASLNPRIRAANANGTTQVVGKATDVVIAAALLQTAGRLIP